MAHFVFVTWDGGGNVSVMLGIARRLVDRGHQATALAPKSLRRTVEALTVGYSEFGTPRPLDKAAAFEHLLNEVIGSPEMPVALRAAADNLSADALVVDCNMSTALEIRTELPVAAVVHTALGLYLAPWSEAVAHANARRAELGQPLLAAPIESWTAHERLLVTTHQAFDRPPTPLPANARYVGPVRSPIASSTTIDSQAWPTHEVVVLISYSTHPLLNRPERIQTALDALADLPVGVIATTSGAFDPRLLRRPANAVVFDYLPHDEAMSRAALVVAHAGHGTTIQALGNGVPMVCVPGIGRDQPAISQRVTELGLGIALTDDATAAEIRDAVTTILRDTSYQARAREFAARVGVVDGAATSADELEGMLNASRS
jgi:UDP:flavonoid glycosyltransferase YjiC (YdhE family)